MNDISTTLDYNTSGALEGALRGIRTEATLCYGRQTHATTEPKRFAEGVAALVEYLEYEVKRRQLAAEIGGNGAPTWTDEHWDRYNEQLERLNRILAHYLVQLADDVESGTLTIEGVANYMNTGQLEIEEPPSQPAKRPPRKRAVRRSTEKTAA